MAEAALRYAAKKRHLAAFKGLGRHLGAGTRVLALATARRSLAMAASNTPADAFLALSLMDALMYGGKVHYRVTPRSRATSSRVRSSKRPRIVALTRLMGFVLPWVFVKML